MSLLFCNQCQAHITPSDLLNWIVIFQILMPLTIEITTFCFIILLQIIGCGDFKQLPPVPNLRYEDEGKYCFESTKFNLAFPHHINLNEVNLYICFINILWKWKMLQWVASDAFTCLCQIKSTIVTTLPPYVVIFMLIEIFGLIRMFIGGTALQNICRYVSCFVI